MWTCPKCGRTFKNPEQDHFCGKAPETIDAYILEQPEDIQKYLYQSMEYFRQHYRMHKSVFHGACLLTGISIILFILQDLRNILVFIPGHRRSRCLKNV